MDLSNLASGPPSSSPAGSLVLGFLDDLDKVTKSRPSRGIPGRVRLLVEFVIAGICAGAADRIADRHQAICPFSAVYLLPQGRSIMSSRWC